ncbi:hypothetical protein HGRIS_003757 [Hohenbuehelia grisea]|uniref:Aminoglycoside phosphotransferase domain-containing protein n=1 Tax=Hohenbuehelia grisea TaxID=104357 RepID=A0ABR3JHE0_9AGAR
MQKIAEGTYNKIFLLTLDNDRKVIARIPTTLAGPAHLVTSSEVATMDYVRGLGTPSPRVLAWCSHADDTPVNSEYIIMERVDGVELGRVWDTLEPATKDGVIREWVAIEKSLTRPIFSGYGSIYYRQDIDSRISRELLTGTTCEKRFVIGPTVERTVWDAERRDMDIDRGACKFNPIHRALPSPTNGSTQGQMHCHSCKRPRERRWIEQYAIAGLKTGPFDPPKHLQEPSAHLALPDRFEAVAPYLIPSDPTLARPILLHNDLHFWKHLRL